MCDKRRTGLWAKDSKKHNTAPKAGAEGWATIRLLTVTVVGGYRDWPTCLTAIIRMANSVKVWRPTTPAKLYVYDKLLERLTQDLEVIAAAFGEFIQATHAWCGCARDTSPSVGTWPPLINPTSEIVLRGARHGRVVTNAVRSPVRSAMLRKRVVAWTSASVMVGTLVSPVISGRDG
jgi:hypothetical protein